MVVSIIPIGNSRGIRFPKIILDKLLVKDKMDMTLTNNGILLTPIKELPRSGWAAEFCTMHKNQEDILDNIPQSGDLEWEW